MIVKIVLVKLKKSAEKAIFNTNLVILWNNSRLLLSRRPAEIKKGRIL
jgi:hypothetical protein